MSRKRFRKRDKLIQRMTRDGLVQENRTTGEKERVSSRLADVSFGRGRVPEQDGGNRSAAAGKRRQSRPIRQTEEAACAAPEPVPSMRMAADTPQAAVSASSEGPPPPASRKRRRDKKARDKRRPPKKRQVMNCAPDAAQREDIPQAESPAALDGGADTGQRESFRGETWEPSPAVLEECELYQRQQTAEYAARPAESSGQSCPQGEPPLPVTDSAPSSMPDRKDRKAVERVDWAERRLERAQNHLPAKRRLSFQPEPAGETGQPRRRLHFEREVQPEYRGPALPARAAGVVKAAAIRKLHDKIRESERENAALEAAHKTEFAVEQGLGRALRWTGIRRRSKPYRILRQAEQRVKRAHLRLAQRTALRDNPVPGQENSLSRWIQRQRIKRKYAQAARRQAQSTWSLAELPRRIARAAAQRAAACKLPLVLAGLLFLAAASLSAGLTSCTTLFSGLPPALSAASAAGPEERYQMYLEALGGGQAYGSPFDFPWLEKVSSQFGYRIHPITGEKKLHRGIDIAAPQGTPIRAVQDGVVVSAGDAGGYGLCVVIEDGRGGQFRYAHCSSLSARAGQEVRRGDVIAAVGSTGQSTGPHLHLEITLDGEYLNPLWFVDSRGQ